MSTETSKKLEITRVIRADRERVFRAWTTAEDMIKWSCPEGASVVDVASDPRPGGAYHITMKIDDETTMTARGHYREVKAPERVVYTWDWDDEEHAVGETVVTVTFRDLGDATEVVLVHDLFPAAEAREGHAEGWKSCLDRLEGLVSGD